MTSLQLESASAFGAISFAARTAAVARLHDCDRRGYLGIAAFALPRGRDGADAGGVRRPHRGRPALLTAFFALRLNNFLYLGSLGLLVYLLVGKGTPGPNRFGLPPA